MAVPVHSPDQAHERARTRRTEPASPIQTQASARPIDDPGVGRAMPATSRSLIRNGSRCSGRSGSLASTSTPKSRNRRTTTRRMTRPSGRRAATPALSVPPPADGRVEDARAAPRPPDRDRRAVDGSPRVAHVDHEPADEPAAAAPVAAQAQPRSQDRAPEPRRVEPVAVEVDERSRASVGPRREHDRATAAAARAWRSSAALETLTAPRGTR